MSDDAELKLVDGRLVSIDALRGFSMLWIIGGSSVFVDTHRICKVPFTKFFYDQFQHVNWEGFHFEDLIMPLFMFVIGAVLPFAIVRRRQRGESMAKIHLHIIKRTVVLIFLGFLMSRIQRFDWENMRWVGVLQRLGICYFFTAIIALHTKWRTQVLIIIVILLGYWAAMTLIPVPGYGPGDLSMEGNLQAYIDQQLLPGRISSGFYGHGDVQGILSTFPATCIVLLGLLAGQWLQSRRSENQKVIALAIAGLTCVGIGYLWGMVFPIIIRIWTSSLILFASGWSMLLLAIFYWIIDVKGYKKWAFFLTVIGANAITIYFLHPRIIDFHKIAEFFFEGILNNAGDFRILIWTTVALTTKWLFLWFLYRHRIFIKV